MDLTNPEPQLRPTTTSSRINNNNNDNDEHRGAIVQPEMNAHYAPADTSSPANVVPSLDATLASMTNSKNRGLSPEVAPTNHGLLQAPANSHAPRPSSASGSKPLKFISKDGQVRSSTRGHPSSSASSSNGKKLPRGSTSSVASTPHLSAAAAGLASLLLLLFMKMEMMMMLMMMITMMMLMTMMMMIF